MTAAENGKLLQPILVLLEHNTVRSHQSAEWRLVLGLEWMFDAPPDTI